MARNGSGTFSVVNTLVPAATITASGLNQNFVDIGSEITNSLALDGQSTMTAPLKAANGSAAAPTYTFGSDADTGFYRITSDSIGLTLGGVLRIEFTTTSISVALPINFAAAINIAGGAQNGAVGTPTYSFASDLDTGMYRIGANNLGVAAGGGKVIDISTATVEVTGVFKATSVTVGSNPTAAPGKPPTYQIFTSGSGATYTTATGATWIRIRAIAGGGGGGGTGTGGTGGTTIFNSVNAVGGTGGGLSATGSNTPGAGGAGGTGGTGTATLRIVGATGATGSIGTAAVSGTSNPASGFGGAGGVSFFGGGGPPAAAAVANSGSGGGGINGVNSGVNAGAGAGGGGAGEYYELIIGSPAATYTYTVGAAGAAGTGGSAGGAGRIIVEEYYN